MENRLDSELELAELIVESYQRELLPEEQNELQVWLEADPRNRVKYTSWRKAGMIRRQKELENFHEKRNWKKIENRITNKRIPKWSMAYYAACAVVLLCGVAGILYWQSGHEKEMEIAVLQSIEHGESKARLIDENGKVLNITADNFFLLKEEDGVVLNNVDNTLKIEVPDSLVKSDVYRTIDIPIGGEYRLILSDGSKIWLNSATRLRFPVRFKGKERKVYLEGEACFEITHNKDLPFIVSVEGMDVKVLGTLFNVKAYKEDAAVYTTLASGKVETMRAKTGQKMLLLPNEQCVYTKTDGNMENRKVDARVYLGWSLGRFIFENENLEEVMKQLERWYGVEIFYENTKARHFRFTGSIGRMEKISAVLEVMELTRQVEFVVKDRIVVVK